MEIKEMCPYGRQYCGVPFESLCTPISIGAAASIPADMQSVCIRTCIVLYTAGG